MQGLLLLVWGASSFSVPVRRVNGGGVFVRGGGLDTLEDGSAFDEAVGRSSRVAVLISAPWCRVCRAIRPKIKRISNEYEEKGVAFYEVSQPAIKNMTDDSDFLEADAHTAEETAKIGRDAAKHMQMDAVSLPGHAALNGAGASAPHPPRAP